MIDIKELRIGNFLERVGYPNSPSIVKGLRQSKQGNVIAMQAGALILDFDEKTLCPILINSKWLDSFGIKWIDDNQKEKPHHEGDIIFFIKGLDYSNSMTDGFKCYELDLTIQYVHELQNLYFALYGTELIYKK